MIKIMKCQKCNGEDFEEVCDIMEQEYNGEFHTILAPLTRCLTCGHLSVNDDQAKEINELVLEKYNDVLGRAQMISEVAGKSE